MSLLTIFVEREGIVCESTYGKFVLRVPSVSWVKIKNRKLMVSQTRTDYYKTHPSLSTGNVKITPNSTLSNFLTEESDGSALFVCYTLEDLPRDTKIKGATCIPAGVYPVTLINSPRFGRGCPAINNVPQFDGIRIHAGTSKNWTEGCVLVGMERTNENSRMASARVAEIVVWNLLANLVNVGHTLQANIRFNFDAKEQLPVKTVPTQTDAQVAMSYMNSGFIGNVSVDNFKSIGEAGDCGCYSLSELDPDMKGDYATQNVKKFLSDTADHVYELVKNKVSKKSYTSGNITTGITNIPVVQDMTNFEYVVPTKESLNVKLEEYTHGKKLDIKAKENVAGSVVFDKSFERTMNYEGDYIYDPLDTAVERKYGLSFNHDREVLVKYGVTDVNKITLDLARAIYKEKYWEPFELSTLNNQDVADLMFDIIVSCGIENGQKVIRKAIRDNYGVQAPDATTWHEFMVVAKYVEGPKFVGELLESKIAYIKSFLLINPDAVKFYDDWINRCEDYRVEINEEDVGGENTKYFVQIFRAIDDWLKNGDPDSTHIYKGVHFLYYNSIQVQSFVPPQVRQSVDFPFVVEWGKVCQMKIDAKTDWATDTKLLMKSQWEIVSECLEKALNKNIVPVANVLGVSSAGQFTGFVTSFLIWSSP